MSNLLLNASRNVLRQVDRSRAALFALAFGVAAMIVATGFIDSNLRFGRENTIRSQLGHIQIVKRGFLDQGRGDPFAYLLPQNVSGLSTLDRTPGFVLEAPRLFIAGLASAGEQTLSFIGEGVDPQAESQLSAGLRFRVGRNLLPGEAQTAIVGQGLADNLGVSVGDLVVLVATTKSGSISAVEAKVVGIFNSITKAYDDVALRIPLPLARELIGVDGEHVRMVLLDETSNVPLALSHLRQTLPGHTVEVVAWYDLADFYNKTSALFSKQVAVIYFIISIVIVLSISNTLTISVLQRIGEIGTMMAMGTRRRAVLFLFMAEGLMLGLVGTASGLILGVLAALAISAIGISMPPGPGMAWSYEVGIDLSVTALATAGAIAMATVALASVYPAWRASRLNIVDALRNLS